MPYGLFDFQDTIESVGTSMAIPENAPRQTTMALGEEGNPQSGIPPQCPNGGIPTLTKFKDPKLGDRDIGFGKGINGTFKCPPPKCAPTMKSGNCNYRLV